MPGPHPDAPKPDVLPCPTCGYDLSTVPRATACPECGTSTRSELVLERHATTVLALNIFAIGLALMAAAIAINLSAGPWAQVLTTTTNQNGFPNPQPALPALAVFRASTALVGIPALVALGGSWILSTRRVLGAAPRLRWWFRVLLLTTGAAVAVLVAHRAIASAVGSTLPLTPSVLRTVYWRDGASYTLALLSPILIGLIITSFGIIAADIRAADLAARCQRWRVAVAVGLVLLIGFNIALQLAWDIDGARITQLVVAARVVTPAGVPLPPIPVPPSESYFPPWFTPEVLGWWRMFTYAAISATLLATFITALQLTALINVRRRLPLSS